MSYTHDIILLFWLHNTDASNIFSPGPSKTTKLNYFLIL